MDFALVFIRCNVLSFLLARYQFKKLAYFEEMFFTKVLTNQNCDEIFVSSLNN